MTSSSYLVFTSLGQLVLEMPLAAYLTILSVSYRHSFETFHETQHIKVKTG